VLGTGVMGSAMARNAVRAGLETRAWSRPLSDAERLADDGVAVAPGPAAAAAGAQLVVTMVPDAEAIESFATGADGFLEAMDQDAVWIQSSTVGVEPADRLIALAAEHGVTIVDAPVLGSKDPAERGELVLLASGEPAALERCGPFFSAVAQRVLKLGPAGAGSRLKMVTNGWIMSAVAAIAESMALAEALGLDGRRFLDAIEGMPMDMGYAHIKGEMIAVRQFPVQMTLAHAVKDASLALEAARGQDLPARVIGAAAELMSAAAAAGWEAEDMAAAFHAAVAPHTTTANPGGNKR
jgi:3-hydroxyisobutyrate dehydrogenase